MQRTITYELSVQDGVLGKSDAFVNPQITVMIARRARRIQTTCPNLLKAVARSRAVINVQAGLRYRLG
jgi:hypothetical protein